MSDVKFNKGDKLVMVKDGSYGSCFKKGDKVEFDEFTEREFDKIEVIGTGIDRNFIGQTIHIDDVELVAKAQTPCDKLGYKVGDQFVVNAGQPITGPYSDNSVIELTRDDGSSIPKFQLIIGRCYRPSGNSYYPLEYIKPLLTAKPHVHAQSMALYAQDALTTEAPWDLWEIKSHTCDVWVALGKFHPSWNDSRQYRRAPAKPKTININGYKVPEPMRVAPEIGTDFFLACVSDSSDDSSGKWCGDRKDAEWLSLGLLHLRLEDERLHTKALLSFTDGSKS